MDNEASAHFKDTIDKNNIKYQLVPPHNHRANLAERAIQSFKYHFKAGLYTVDPDFPVAQWDQLLDQAEITINLLRNAIKTQSCQYTHTYLDHSTFRKHQWNHR